MSINAPIKRIQHNPWQTRHGEPQPEYIKELALDIATNGLLQTPLGRLVDSEGAAVEVAWPDTVIEMKFHEGDGLQVQLAFGHNRLAAYRMLADGDAWEDDKQGYDVMPVDLRQLTDEQMAIMAWSENEKRRDVTAIERAMAIQQRISDFEWTNRQAAEALGIDHSTVANLLRLLKLPDDIQQAILSGDLTERQAAALLPLYDAPVDLFNIKLVGYYRASPHSIVKDALAGQSSDKTRKDVGEFLEFFSKDLSKAEFKLDQLLPEGGDIYCGMCSTCDKRMPSRNRCFLMLCYRAKTDYMHHEYLKKASFSSGYGILDPSKSGYPTHIPSGGETYEKIIASKCQNLVLQYTEYRQGTSLPHFPHAYLVCEMRNNSCRCLKGLIALKELGNAQPVEVPGTIEEAMLDPNGEPLPEIDYDGIAAAELGVNVAPAPVMASDLEDIARQARKAKMDAEKKADEYKQQLEEHLYRCIAEYQSPGALYAAVKHYMHPLDSELVLEKIWRYLAFEATRTIMPIQFNNEPDLVSRINQNLDYLKIPHLGSSDDDKQPEVDFPVF